MTSFFDKYTSIRELYRTSHLSVRDIADQFSVDIEDVHAAIRGEMLDIHIGPVSRCKPEVIAQFSEEDVKTAIEAFVLSGYVQVLPPQFKRPVR